MPRRQTSGNLTAFRFYQVVVVTQNPYGNPHGGGMDERDYRGREDGN